MYRLQLSAAPTCFWAYVLIAGRRINESAEFSLSNQGWQLPRCDHVVGPHHFVVLVLEDVAMPDVTTDKTFEANDDSCDHPRIRSHRIFPSGFVRIGRYRRPRVLHHALVLIKKRFKAAPVEDLESNQMQMDGVGIIGQVNQVPDF